jgi:hypothetical protein
LIKTLAFSVDETQVYAVTDDVGLYRFRMLLDDLIREANGRVGKASVGRRLPEVPSPAALSRPPPSTALNHCRRGGQRTAAGQGEDGGLVAPTANGR